MSRIGKQPIKVPSGVKVDHNPQSRTINIEGPKGKLAFNYRPEVIVEFKDNTFTCSIKESDKELKLPRALWGTTRARIQNMIVGVTQAYSKKLEIIGVGWGAKQAGKNLQLNVGYADPVLLTPPMGVAFSIEQSFVTVSGPNKETVGEFAAKSPRSAPA